MSLVKSTIPEKNIVIVNPPSVTPTGVGFQTISTLPANSLNGILKKLEVRLYISGGLSGRDFVLRDAAGGIVHEWNTGFTSTMEAMNPPLPLTPPTGIKVEPGFYITLNVISNTGAPTFDVYWMIEPEDRLNALVIPVCGRFNDEVADAGRTDVWLRARQYQAIGQYLRRKLYQGGLPKELWGPGK